jgi:two-component system chemotaxis response regulator CheB
MRQIRVLVVEDSLLFRELLVTNLNQDPQITVVATANNPFEARDAIIAYKPDVMTLDIELPCMNGIEFLRKLMPQYPMPVIMISSLSDRVFDAMAAGAVDFVDKTSLGTKLQTEKFIRKELTDKIKVAAVANLNNIRKKDLSENVMSKCRYKPGTIIAIGASTGGTEAIVDVVRNFGMDMPGVVIVQHMPAGFTKLYAERLNTKCQMAVKEAEHGDIVRAGNIYLAPGGEQHMQIVRVGDNYQISLKTSPKVNGHCPSVDVLFESVAKAAKESAIGILLTGMGGDGAKGLLHMKEAGAHTIGQDASTCVVYGMPRVAYEIGAVEYQEKLADISRRTYQLLNR